MDGSHQPRSRCCCPRKVIQVFFVDRLILVRGPRVRCIPWRGLRPGVGPGLRQRLWQQRLGLLRQLCRSPE